MLGILPILALTWLPAEGWTERPDPFASERAVKGGTLRFNGGQGPKSYNGYVDCNTYTAMLFSLMYDQLLGTDPETTDIVPALARRWAVSEDGCEFTFELDARARWSDGLPVTAEDVKWTFDEVMKPSSDTGAWKAILCSFESPEILGERTVRFRRKPGSAKDWRDVLNCSSFWVLPSHAFRGRDFNRLDFTAAPVGGAYRLARVDEQVEAEFARVDAWWRRDLPSTRRCCNFDRLVVRYYADNENAFEALKKRAIDVYPVYSARIMAAETRGPRFDRNWLLRRRVRNRHPVGFQGFAMNMRRKPFDDVRVRRAMAMLIDRETMNRTMMFGEYFLQNSFFQDLYDAGRPCTNAFYRYDVEGARRLLAEAGYADGFRFTFLSRGAGEDKFLALFSHALRACNVTMDIDRKDFAGWMRDMDEFNYDMTWASFAAGLVRYPETMWHSSEADRRGGNNITGFRNAEVDRLIAAEKRMATMEERREAYRRMDSLIAAECPYAFLWNIAEVRLVYWNKFGMPPRVLSRYGDESAVLSYWWYDADRADELRGAMNADGFLPSVPEIVEGR